jgi:hypothetical protein
VNTTSWRRKVSGRGRRQVTNVGRDPQTAGAGQQEGNMTTSNTQAVCVPDAKAPTPEAQRLEDQFLSGYRRGVDMIVEAARAYVALLDVDPTARERLIIHRGFSRSSLNALERIGRGTLLPEIHFHAPEFGRLPIDEQRRLLENPIPFLVEKPDGTRDKTYVNPVYAPPNVRAQLFDSRGHIRSDVEQHQWLVARANRRVREEQVQPPPFRATATGLQVFRPTSFSWADIRRIMVAYK